MPMHELFPLRVESLSLEKRSQILLNNISFELNAKSLTIVMGANGAGKSLLLRALHGLVKPSAGKVYWNNKTLSLEIRQRQAMLFQRPVLFRRSVAANVDYALALGHSSESLTREELLDEVGLLELASRPARLLSGGEQQRLAFARALATSPDVLFLDEPTSSLDPASALLLEKLIQRQHQIGTKIIFVTHDIGQARRLADDVIFLHAGRVQEHTSALQFFNQPKSNAADAYLDGQLYI